MSIYYDVGYKVKLSRFFIRNKIQLIIGDEYHSPPSKEDLKSIVEEHRQISGVIDNCYHSSTESFYNVNWSKNHNGRYSEFDLIKCK